MLLFLRGGGLAIVGAQLEAKTDKYSYLHDDDVDLGIWIAGGFYWNISESFNLGIDGRVSRAKVKLFDEDLKAGGYYLGLLIGYHWGQR